MKISHVARLLFIIFCLQARTGIAQTVAPASGEPPAQRVPKTEMGISQQPNDKMKWWLDAKFGMFIHWGLYAGPGNGEWYRENAGMSEEAYRQLAYPASGDRYFAADSFNADDWAALAKAAGMKYMVMVTQHHDGYALFDSKYMGVFTSKQTHNRDFVKEYVDACRSNGLRVGLYKTLINWRYPGYYDVTGKDCKPNKFGYTTDIAHKENARLMKEELYCLTKELVTKYGKIDEIFWDGGWLGQQGTDADGAFFWEPGKYLDSLNQWPVNPYFQDKDPLTGRPLGLVGMVRKYQPDVIMNPRSGWRGDYNSEEGGAPVTGPVRTKELYEKCMSITPVWGYTRDLEDPAKLMSLAGLKRMLADCVVRNMALLVNVGPDRHGRITKAETDLLLHMGEWLQQVGDAVYGTRGGPWDPKDGQYGFAWKDSTIYIYLLGHYNEPTFTLPALHNRQRFIRAYMVAGNKPVKARQDGKGQITLSGLDNRDGDIDIIAVQLDKKVME